MATALHGISSFHSNLITDIRLAREAGFDELEIFYPKLARFLACGGSLQTLGRTIEELVCVSVMSARSTISSVTNPNHSPNF